MVELAVSASVILSLVLGMFQMGLVLYAYHFTADAAREASRWAIVRGNLCSTYTPGLDHCNASSSDIQNYVRGLGYPFANNLNVSATWLTAGTAPAMTWTACGVASSCKAQGNQVQVSVSYSFPVYIPFWSGRSIGIGSTSSMVVAQ